MTLQNQKIAVLSLEILDGQKGVQKEDKKFGKGIP